MRRPGGSTWGVAVVVVMVAALVAGSASAVQVGEKAPDFALTAPDGKSVKLADLLGKGPVVIYTFIQAYTPT